MKNENNSQNDSFAAITPYIGNDGKQAVNARDLYEWLGAKSEFSNWFRRMKSYGFESGTDYVKVGQIVYAKKVIKSENQAHRPQINYALTMDMAKEVAMLQRTPRGRQARQYFIKCEEKLIEGLKAKSTSGMLDEKTVMIMIDRIILQSKRIGVLEYKNSLLENKQRQQDENSATAQVGETPHFKYTKNYTVTSLAKEFGFKSAAELNKFLKSKGVQEKVNKKWFLTDKYKNLGYTISKDLLNEDGTDTGIKYMVWTKSGKAFVKNLIKETNK